MLKDALKTIILSQQEWLIPEGREITREQLKSMGALPPFAYILTGVRRSGKSTLMMQLMREQTSHNYFNFEDSRAAGFELADFRTVEELFSELFGSSQMIFFDEIQNITGWQKFARRMADSGYRTFITGSNSEMLSSEMASTLGGRFLVMEIKTLSFPEFLLFHGMQPVENKESVCIAPAG